MATRPQKTTNESLGQAAVQCFINTQSVVTSHGNKTVNTASPAEPDACESPTGAYYQHTFRHHAGPGTSLWEAARSKPRRSVLDQFLRAIVWMEPYTARLPAGYVCPDNPGRGSGPPAPHKTGTALDTECSLPPGLVCETHTLLRVPSYADLCLRRATLRLTYSGNPFLFALRSPFRFIFPP